MRYKDDWEKVKERHIAYWNREIVDRCCIRVTVFDRNADRAPLTLPQSDEDRICFWTDAEWVVRRFQYEMKHTYYGGDAFPSAFINLGATSHAGFFRGANYKFADTVWHFPSIEDVDALDELAFDENSFMYQKTMELARAFAEDSQGDYVVGMTDCTGNADALAQLLGSEELLSAMVTDPDVVKTALNKMQYAYKRVMGEVYDIVRDVNEGGSAITWMGTWAPGLHAQMQCDLSVMISNPMFKEFAMPELREQCRFLDYPMYHLDGMEQIRHLDDLLSIPELKAIQWTQVDGQPPCTAFFPVLRRIQEAGKCLLIGVSPDQISPIMENLSSKGLLLCTGAATREEADAIVQDVARMTRD